jgi:hypothetical protein
MKATVIVVDSKPFLTIKSKYEIRKYEKVTANKMPMTLYPLLLVPLIIMMERRRDIE